MRRLDHADGDETPARRIGAAGDGTFDFGEGPVEAERHTNPDGSVGGWVAFTANADPESYIAPDAVVFGNARVFGTAELLDSAVVCDNARVLDGAVIAGVAMVGGESTVEDAVVAEAAVVVGSAHISKGAQIAGNARVGGTAKIMGEALVWGEAQIKGKVWVSGGDIGGTMLLDGNVVVKPGAVLDGDEELFTGTFTADNTESTLLDEVEDDDDVHIDQEPDVDEVDGLDEPDDFAAGLAALAPDEDDGSPTGPSTQTTTDDDDLGLDELVEMA